MNNTSSLPREVYWLSGIVIALAALNAMMMEFVFASPTVLQYRVTIIFLCFALSSVTALLFASTVKFEAKWGPFVVTVLGSAGLWLIALAVFIYLFPEDPIDNATNAALTQKINQALEESKSAPRELQFVLSFPPDPNNPDRPDPRAPRGLENTLKVTGHIVHAGSMDDLTDPTFHFAPSPGALVGIFSNVRPDDEIYVETDDGAHQWRSYSVLVPPTPFLQMVLQNGGQP